MQKVEMDQRQKLDNKKNRSKSLQIIKVKAWGKSSFRYKTNRKQKQNQKSSKIIALLVIKVKDLKKFIYKVLNLKMHKTSRK